MREYKKRFSHFFPTIFSQHFLFALFVCFWKNCFARLPPPFFGHDIRVNIKKLFFTLLFYDFFTTYFARTIRLILQNLFRSFFTPFFGINIRVNVKNVFSHFFSTIFSKLFCSHYSCVSGNIVSRFFSPHFLVTIFVCI